MITPANCEDSGEGQSPRYPLRMKFADFGVAKDANDLATFCGSTPYAAPEIWYGPIKPTTEDIPAARDIWSLALTVFRFAYGLPKLRGEFNYIRDFEILNKAIHSIQPDSLIDFLRQYMLKMEPKERLSASDCLDVGSELFQAAIPTSYDETEVMTPTEAMTPTEVMTPTGEYQEDSNLGVVETPINYPSFRLGDDQQLSLSGDDDLPPTQRGSPEPEEEVNGDADEEEEWLPEERTVQVTVDGKDVSMRMSDYWLNATQIQALAGMIISENQTDTWVCYEDGRLLCEIYGLTDKLRKLLEHPPETIKAQQVGQFINFPTGTGNTISIRSTDLWTNGTDILKEAGLDKELLQRIKEWLTIQTTGSHRLEGCHRGVGRGQDGQDTLATVPPTTAVAGWNHGYLEGPQTWNPRVDAAEWMPPTQRGDEVEEEGEETYEEEDEEDECVPSAPSSVTRKQLKRPLDERPRPPIQRKKASREEQRRYVQINVHGKDVSMRKSDYWLNATQILALANKTPGQVKHTLDIMRKHTTVKVEKARKGTPHATSWVCYEHGRLLCDALGLTDRLRPLLNCEIATPKSQQVHQMNYLLDYLDPPYIYVDTGNNIVSIRKPDFWVNANHILKVAGLDRSVVTKIRESGIPCDVVKGGHAKHQGTYIEPLEWRKLCDTHGLVQLKGLLQRTVESLASPTRLGIEEAPTQIGDEDLDKVEEEAYKEDEEEDESVPVYGGAQACGQDRAVIRGRKDQTKAFLAGFLDISFNSSIWIPEEEIRQGFTY